MKRLQVLVDALFVALFVYWLVTGWGHIYLGLNIAGLSIWSINLTVHICQLWRSRPDETVQLLRGARLALQHHKDLRNAVGRADLEYLTVFHVREFRSLSFAARTAYNAWKPFRGRVYP